MIFYAHIQHPETVGGCRGFTDIWAHLGTNLGMFNVREMGL